MKAKSRADRACTTQRSIGRTGAMALLAAVSLMAASAQATNYYWDNESGNGLYTNSVNWHPNGLPETTDYTADVVILGKAGVSPMTVTRLLYAKPSWATTRNLCHLRFDTAGWTYESLQTIQNLKTLASYGAGTNTLNFYWEQMGSQTWTVGAGNTLRLAQSFYCRANTITLTGGGVLQCVGAFSGFGAPSIYGIKVQNATLRIEAATPSSAAGVVWIDAKTARLQLRTSVAAASSLIGPTRKIRDNVGRGLRVTDIGGGYVEIAVKTLPTILQVR